MRLLTITAIAAATAAGSAYADGHKCFDKGSLSFVDCEPAIVDAPPPAPAPAVVDDKLGYYVAIKGGVVFPEDTDFAIGGPITVENEYDEGYAVSGVAGLDLGEVSPGVGLRFDVELGYQRMGVSDHIVLGAAQPGPTGDTDVLFGFLNLYGDIDLYGDLDLVVGGGVGAGLVDFEAHGAGGAVLMDDDGLGFGYHLDAGLAYDLDDAWTLGATYRYMSFLDVELNDINAFGEPDVDSHQALIEIRHNF